MFTRAFIAALCLLAILPLGAGAADQHYLAAQLVADARGDRLADHECITGCLIAGGVSDAADLAAHLSAIDRALEQALASLPPMESDQDRAARLHEALHRHVLTGRYDRHASDLSQTLSTGDYNCLRATALYWELCRRAGVQCQIIAQSGHVYCLVGSPGVRVEAASRQYSPTSEVPDSPAAQRITPTQLAARFTYNRGIELLQRRQFEPGVAALRLACQLDPEDADAQANLLAGLNNWAVALADDQPAAAAALIARGLAIDPDYAPLVANRRYVAERIGGRNQP